MPFAHLVPAARIVHSLFGDADFHTQRAFFAGRPELTPTPLRPLPGLAAALGLGALLVKDETARFGLDAFKAAGTTFAVATLQARGQIRPGDTLICASEGNHGRAVARAARDAGCPARVYMADTVAPARIRAIEDEGARVVSISGSYDDAVRRMAEDAGQHGWTVVSDTSWDGYEDIPHLIMLGYTRLMDEAEAAWMPDPPPDVVFVQTGVGGLLAAVACWAHWRYGPARPLIVGVEPTGAACMQRAVERGRRTPLPGPFDTIMGGLRCGEVSLSAFRAVRTLVDAYVAIEDDWAKDAMRRLARPAAGDDAVHAGPSGAAALAAVVATLRDPALDALRARLRLGERSRVMVFATEGVTDPALFADVMAGPAGRLR